MKFLKYLIPLFIICLSVVFFKTYEHAQVPSALYLTWLHDPTHTMTVQWHNEDGENTQVYYQKEGKTTWLAKSGATNKLNQGTFLWGTLFVHSVELTDLEPDTVYVFRLGLHDKLYRFRTMPDDTSGRPVHFVVGGDVYQDDIFRFKKMNDQVAKLDPDFVVIGGDIAYTRGHNAFLKGRYFEIKRWQTFFKAWKNQMVTSDGRLIPMVVVIGNHDLESSHPDPRVKPVLFYEFFAMPEPFVAYRTLDYGNYLSLFLLDTGHTYPISGNQTRWLQGALAESQLPHKMAVYHVSAYPSVYDFNKGNRKLIRKHWVPLFEQYGVKTAFEHHDHAFKRTYRIKEGKVDPDGVLYLGDGAWAIDVRQPRKAESAWYLAKTQAINFVYFVSLQQSTQVVQAIDNKGNIFDQVISEESLVSQAHH